MAIVKSNALMDKISDKSLSILFLADGFALSCTHIMVLQNDEVLDLVHFITLYKNIVMLRCLVLKKMTRHHLKLY